MKEAIILLNMGGPNNLREVEMFLTNMFNDPAIIRTKSALLRRFIAGIITLSRAEKSQEIYRQIGGKSPIVDLTTSLVTKLQAAVGEEVIVDFVMRYTPPMAKEVIEKLKKVVFKKSILSLCFPNIQLLLPLLHSMISKILRDEWVGSLSWLKSNIFLRMISTTHFCLLLLKKRLLTITRMILN